MTTNDGMTNGRVIHIRMGMVNQPIVEDIANEAFMDSAIFGNQYRQILTMLNRYVTYRKNATERNIDAANNVFTFVGERGSGKTSCMSSVSRLLTGNRLKDFTAYPQLGTTKFETIDIIDPSYFDERHNIVATVIAKLFKSFRQKEDADSHEQCNFDVHRDLVAAFARVQKNIMCLLGDHAEEDGWDDDIENLSDMSMAVDLREDISRLVDLYMKFVKKEDGILLLSIDDIDLNIDEADTMTEQIRKYLVSPNIVILLAAKLDQLATIMNLHYSEKYRYLIDKQRIGFDTVEEMTGQYLVKFAPEDQRVYMPSTDFYMESGIEIENDNVGGTCVKQAIPELIFSRTRYLFYNSKHEASCIVPRYLRKMCQLAAMIWSMDKYHDGDGMENKRIFRNYLFQTWMQDNLTNEDRKLAKRILEGWKNEQLNRVTLDVLKETYAEWFEKQMQTGNLDNNEMAEELKQIYDVRNREYNLSVGDVMSLIYNLQIAYETHADRCFFFIIESVYSIALYESYDWITDKMDAEGYDEYAPTPAETRKQILLYDPFSDEKVEPYHRLVGGRFYNFRLAPVLSKEKIGTKTKFMVSRSDRIINYEELERLMNEAIAKWEAYNQLTDEEKADETRLKELKQCVRIVEFFMLCCIRDINLRNSGGKREDYYDPTFRQSESAYYNGEFTGIRSLYFDLGAFFYNITCINACYKRFRQTGRRLLELCKEDSERRISLYAVFRKMAIDYRPDTRNPHAWQSCASIRNTEILFDLYLKLKSVNKVKGIDNRLFLAKFFEKLGEYAIETYDRDVAQSHLTISFEFAKKIEELLRSKDIAERFEVVFNITDNEAAVEETGMSMAQKLDSLADSWINVESLVAGRSMERNRKKTVLNYLKTREKKVLEGKDVLVQSVFDKYDDYMTREEIRKAGNDLNQLLIVTNGKFKTDTENTVSQPETAEHPDEPQGES